MGKLLAKRCLTHDQIRALIAHGILQSLKGQSAKQAIQAGKVTVEVEFVGNVRCRKLHLEALVEVFSEMDNGPVTM